MVRQTREEIICDIKAITTYTDKDFEGKTYNQLVAMRTRIVAAMDMYYREISNYFKENPDKRIMSNQDLRLLNYNELAKMRKELGLGKKRVTSVSEGTHQTKMGLKVVKDKDVRDLARDIIVSQDEYERQESFLYAEEIQEMGYANFSKEELLRIGIIPLEVEESHFRR